MDRRSFLMGAAGLGGAVLLGGCGSSNSGGSPASSPAKGGQAKGQQYFIPWDWGYGSVIYRTDKVDPADATGWELFWNPKYKGRISMWNGNTTNFEIAALKLGYGAQAMDNLSDDQLTNAKNALIEQYPLNKFLWSSEYTDLQPALQNGDVWVAYSWQDQWVYAKSK